MRWLVSRNPSSIHCLFLKTEPRQEALIGAMGKGACTSRIPTRIGRRKVIYEASTRIQAPLRTSRHDNRPLQAFSRMVVSSRTSPQLISALSFLPMNARCSAIPPGKRTHPAHCGILWRCKCAFVAQHVSVSSTSCDSGFPKLGTYPRLIPKLSMLWKESWIQQAATSNEKR